MNPTAPYVDSPRSVVSQKSTFVGKLVALIGVLVSVAYLANLGGGIFFEIPDILPGIGNLDEAFFTAVLLASLAKLGIPVLPRLLGNRNT
jgi:hypothetical protein